MQQWFTSEFLPKEVFLSTATLLAQGKGHYACGITGFSASVVAHGKSFDIQKYPSSVMCYCIELKSDKTAYFELVETIKSVMTRIHSRYKIL